MWRNTALARVTFVCRAVQQDVSENQAAEKHQNASLERSVGVRQSCSFITEKIRAA